MALNTRVKRKKQSELISERLKQISPSGIRKFFDLLASMEGIISYFGATEADIPFRDTQVL